MSRQSQPGPRKPLRAMAPAELQRWFLEQRAELEDFCSYAQHWRKGRERRHIYTLNDERYDQFLSKAPDLIAGLDELRKMVAENIKQEQKEEEDT